MVRFYRMFVFQKSSSQQIKAILVLSLPETMKTKSESQSFSAPRSFSGSSVLKQGPGDNGTQLTVRNTKILEISEGVI